MASPTSAPSVDALLARLEQRIDDRPKSHLSSEEQIHIAVAAALDRKAEDAKVLHLGTRSDVSDYFFLCSGTNERQVQAIADHVEESLRRAGVKPLHVEGFRNARWVLMDYGGDLVIHVFHRAARDFYDLERLWGDAPDVTERYTAPLDDGPLDEPPLDEASASA